MFKNILGTIGSRYFVAFLNLVLIFVNAKVLGRAGMGLVGVVYASANIAFIFNSILCGNTIVYFMNRYGIRYVFNPAYLWAFFGSLISCAVMYVVGMIPTGFEAATFCLAMLLSFVSANQLMLLGKDRVKWFNLTYIINGVLLFAVLMYMYFAAERKSVQSYLFALYVSNGVVFLISLFMLVPYLREKADATKSFFSVLKEMLVYGLWSSVDNLAEGLTNRLNYFLIQSAGGFGYVGLLDSGTKMSESVWHISRSIGFMEYNSVSKTAVAEEQKKVTLQLFKLTCCALIIVMLIIVCIPERFYTDYLFTKEFIGIRKVIICLAVGIVALGSNHILSHYFIGSGQIRYSAYCSVFGLAVLLIAGLILIPTYGVFGAAVTSSIAYTAMLIFSTVVFMRRTHTRISELLPSKQDLNYLREKCHLHR